MRINNQGFTKSWEVTNRIDNGKGYITYGFNKFVFDEDYVKGNPNWTKHYVALKNGSGWPSSSTHPAGTSAHTEVRHSGRSVSYYLYY